VGKDAAFEVFAKGLLDVGGWRVVVALAGAFGDTRFFQVEPNHFPQGSPFFSTAGGESYNQRDADKARSMAEAAGYKGEPVRVLTSRQYDFHYKMALVMAEQLKRAGFKPDLQVVDWATLVQRRNDSSLWDIYVTHSGLLPEPMLSLPQLGDGAPGWRSTPAKQAALQEFNHITVPAKRGAGWAKVQQVVYDEVPYMNLGKFSSLACGAFATAGGLSAFAVALLLEHAVEELNFHRRAVPGPAPGSVRAIAWRLSVDRKAFPNLGSQTAPTL